MRPRKTKCFIEYTEHPIKAVGLENNLGDKIVRFSLTGGVLSSPEIRIEWLAGAGARYSSLEDTRDMAENLICMIDQVLNGEQE